MPWPICRKLARSLTHSLTGGDAVLDTGLLQGLHGLHYSKQRCHVVPTGRCSQGCVRGDSTWSPPRASRSWCGSYFSRSYSLASWRRKRKGGEGGLTAAGTRVGHSPVTDPSTPLTQLWLVHGGCREGGRELASGRLYLSGSPDMHPGAGDQSARRLWPAEGPTLRPPALLHLRRCAGRRPRGTRTPRPPARLGCRGTRGCGALCDGPAETWGGRGGH